MSEPLPNPNQQNMIQTIQPAQATRLLEALKDELAKAKAAGPDTAKARLHYARAEQIKQVLVNYRQQQQQRQAAAARVNSAGSFAGATPTSSATTGPGMATQNTVPGSAPAHTNQAQFHNSNVGSRPGSTGFASGANAMGSNGPVGSAAGLGQTSGSSAPGAANAGPQQQQRTGIYSTNQMPNTHLDSSAQQRPSSVTPGVTTEKYNQVRTRLQDLEKKIRTLEAGKRPDMNPDENTQFENQLRELKLKYAQYSKFALYMKNQLIEMARVAGHNPAVGASPATKPSTPGMPPAAASAHSGTPAQSINTPAMTNALQVASNVNASQENKQAANATGNAIAPGAGTPVKSGSRGPSPSVKEPTIPGVNLSLITKPSVPSIPILSTINVKPHNPITLKPGANNVRPTLTAGGSSGLGQVVNSPAMFRMPTFDMASTGSIQDNGGRVLTKRKLTELVNTIGADEGDGKTTIDGDVEELLLDLADEFVSSVTTFACRLAKHRKTDAIDVRDVQLHLERNWNIRIPGHSMDDIRSMRKWQPSSSYTQKVSGVDIVKAVNGNIN